MKLMMMQVAISNEIVCFSTSANTANAPNKMLTDCQHMSYYTPSGAGELRQ